ncbi:hypothetical protein L6164_031863 [Bauhinia variegata]|uniref:Uncharacterized protein n=1 Tax=Bauhinia variegata TaxID=167791 RepID=A0ACB9KLP2_BAUVA|nr:hypothetical protein L6164_031863 [Bauhinia variegata]
MAPYLDEDSMKSNKPKGLSLFASIFSLFISIYIFYIFSLSPYTIFNNTIFWFLMSNTLILIIAADYGAFSSSKDKQDIYLYEEYVKHSRARNYVPSSYVPKYQQVDEKRLDIKQAKPGGGEILQENNKETITPKSEIPERVLEIVVQNDPKKPSCDESVNKEKPALALQMNHCEASEEKPIPERALRRCKSYRHDSRKHVVIDESKNAVWRSESMRQEERVLEEENEFSSMTTEELNRRVEEFIQRLHRQMRLQAARNMHQI